jgi:Protein of unknown function (DUF402)
MNVNALPAILERKRTLDGAEKLFPCRLLERSYDALKVLFVSTRTYQVANLALPVGTVTFGHFWRDRPYNAYHWMTPSGTTLAHYFNLADETALPDGDLAETFSFRDLVVDVLVRPGGIPEVLDQHELPTNLAAATKDAIERALAALFADLPALGPTLEAEADVLWPRVFGSPRA